MSVSLQKNTVTLIDYGMGNLLSVRRAFEHCGAQVELTADPEVISQAEFLVLPGVGAFKDGMDGLRAIGVVEALQSFAKSGKAFLGICLGMQMLHDFSEEFGHHQGLGLIPGKVAAIPRVSPQGLPLKIPHIGWSPLRFPGGVRESILSLVEAGESVYFVHSFAAITEDAKDTLAEVDYDGQNITAAVRRDNVMGCQFHPEKSGTVGLKIIRAFLELGKQC